MNTISEEKTYVLTHTGQYAPGYGGLTCTVRSTDDPNTVPSRVVKRTPGAAVPKLLMLGGEAGDDGFIPLGRGDSIEVTGARLRKLLNSVRRYAKRGLVKVYDLDGGGEVDLRGPSKAA